MVATTTTTAVAVVALHRLRHRAAIPVTVGRQEVVAHAQADRQALLVVVVTA